MNLQVLLGTVPMRKRIITRLTCVRHSLQCEYANVFSTAQLVEMIYHKFDLRNASLRCEDANDVSNCSDKKMVCHKFGMWKVVLQGEL